MWQVCWRSFWYLLILILSLFSKVKLRKVSRSKTFHQYLIILFLPFFQKSSTRSALLKYCLISSPSPFSVSFCYTHWSPLKIWILGQVFKPKYNFDFLVINDKVEEILKGSLDLTPSPSPSNYGWESLVEVWRQKIVGCCQQTFENIKFVDNAQQYFFLYTFPVHNLVMGLNPG